MTTVNPTRAINLSQLESELKAAGVSTGRGLTGHGTPDRTTAVYALDPNLKEIDLAPAAGPIITAHVPQPTELEASASDLATNYQNAMTRLDQIISASSMTAPQLTAAVQDEARILRRTLRLIYSSLIRPAQGPGPGG